MHLNHDLLESILVNALEIESENEKLEYLDQACGTDAELRKRINELIDNHQQARNFLLSEEQVDGPACPAQEESGSVIGPYTLLQKIGEGGMGVVFLAEQTQPLQRRVALKVIRTGMNSAQVVARFEQERQALAVMDHPHIARVIDGGTTADHRPWFAMELVKGIPITNYCDQERLSVRDRVALFIPVCQAIQHAHQKGVIHRDLKPSNVLIALYDNAPVPKVIDFGVAKAIGQLTADRAFSTDFGQIVGTLEYMAPEQAEMNNLDIDTRADIYSMGVLLYELLTGSTPFTSAELRGSGMGETIRMLKEVEPTKPSTKLSKANDVALVAANRGLEPQRLARALRGELDWITMKCLEKNRSRRYETANGLALDLQRFLSDEPVSACPPTARYRFSKFIGKHRGAFVGVLTLAMLLIGATAISGWLAFRATRAERTSKGNLNLAIEAVDQFCTRVTEDARLKEQDLRPLRRDLLQKAVGFHQQLLELRDKSSLAQIDLARSLGKLATLTAEIEAHDQAIMLFRQAVETYDDLLRDEPDDPSTQFELCQTLNRLGPALVNAGNSVEAEAVVRRSIILLTSLAEREPNLASIRSELANAHARLGSLLSMTQRMEEAQESLRLAIGQWEALQAEQPDKISLMSQLALAHLKLGDAIFGSGLKHWKAAEVEIQTALSIQRKAIARPDATSAEYVILGSILRALGEVKKVSMRLDEAMTCFREASDCFKKLQLDEPSVLSHVAELALVQIAIAKCELVAYHDDASQTAYQTAASLLKDLVRRAPGNIVWESHLGQVLTNLANFATDRGDYDDAVEQYDRSVTILESILVREPQSRNATAFLPNTLGERAQVLAHIGRHADALRDVDRAIALTRDDERCRLRLVRSWVLMNSRDYRQAAAEVHQLLDALAADSDRHFLVDIYIQSANILAGCAVQARDDKRQPDSDRVRLFDEYSATAIDLLRKAIDAGFNDLQSLRESAELSGLRDHPGFKDLLKED